MGRGSTLKDLALCLEGPMGMLTLLRRVKKAPYWKCYISRSDMCVEVPIGGWWSSTHVPSQAPLGVYRPDSHQPSPAFFYLRISLAIRTWFVFLHRPEGPGN